MIANVKDWKDSAGKQFIVIERSTCIKNCEGKDYIEKVKALNLPFNPEIHIGQQVWSFDDTFNGLRAKIIANVVRFYEDMIHINIDIITYVNENADMKHEDSDWRRTNKKIEIDELKDNMFFVGLFEEFMGEALKREKNKNTI